MIWISLDFDRPPFTACDDNSLGIPVESCRRREMQWSSRNDFLRLFYVRNDFLNRLLCACTQTRQRKRSASKAQKFATAQIVRPVGCAGREFVAIHFLVETERRAARRTVNVVTVIVGAALSASLRAAPGRALPSSAPSRRLFIRSSSVANTAVSQAPRGIDVVLRD